MNGHSKANGNETICVTLELERKYFRVQNVEKSQKAPQRGKGTGGSPAPRAIWEGPFPPTMGALRGEVNKQLCHSTCPTLLCSWGTNAAPGDTQW